MNTHSFPRGRTMDVRAGVCVSQVTLTGTMTLTAAVRTFTLANPALCLHSGNIFAPAVGRS